MFPLELPTVKRFVFLALLSLTLTTASLAQTPSPSPSVAAPANTQANPSPTVTSSAASSSVKISTSGLELSGFPIWIIWVLLATGVVAVVLWIILTRTAKNDAPGWPFAVTAILALIAVVGLLLSIGSWWGRRSSRAELQQLIAIRSATSEVPAPQTTLQSQEPQGVEPSWPFYMVVMGFILLVGIEGALFMFLYLRWGRNRVLTDDINVVNRPLNDEINAVKSALKDEIKDLKEHLNHQSRNIEERQYRAERELEFRLRYLEDRFADYMAKNLGNP